MRKSILLALTLCLSALPIIFSSPKACTTQLSEHWRGRVFYCKNDPECYHCPIKYTQCVADYPGHSEDNCNVCILPDHVQLSGHRNLLGLNKCFLQSKESTKLVTMKLKDHTNCGPIQNKSESFSTMWLRLLEEHLVSNIMIDTVKTEFMLFRINYRKGINFPCVKKFSECDVPEAHLGPQHLEHLYECMKCSCPTENMDENSTEKNHASSGSKGAIVGGVVGGFLFLFLVAGAVFFRYWRSRREGETGVRITEKISCMLLTLFILCTGGSEPCVRGLQRPRLRG